MATIKNLFVDAGSDFNVTITVRQSNGTPFDLSNYTAESQIRKSHESSQYYSFITTIQPQTASQGKITLELPAADSEEIPHGRWLYDIEITLTEQDQIITRKRILEGIVDISPQITQDITP